LSVALFQRAALPALYAVPVVCYLIARRGRAEELRREGRAPALAA
jgi:hypothetical protein